MVVLIELFTSQTSKFGLMTFKFSPIHTCFTFWPITIMNHFNQWTPFHHIGPFVHFHISNLNTWANYIWFTLGLVRGLVHTLINNISTISTNQFFLIIWVLLIFFLFISQILTLGPMTFTLTLGPKLFFQNWYFMESCVC